METGTVKQNNAAILNQMAHLSFLELLKHVASHYTIEKMFGENGKRKDVAVGIGTTIAALALADSNKSAMAEGYLVEDYKLPSGSGLLELASIAKIWLFDGTIGIQGSEILTKDISRGIFAAWVDWDSEGKPIMGEDVIYTPQRLITELNSIYKLNGQSAPAYMNVRKEEITLADISVIDGKRISNQDTMISKVVALFFGLTFPQLSQYGVASVSESDRVLASWLFSTSGQQGETLKEG